MTVEGGTDRTIRDVPTRVAALPELGSEQT